MKFSPATVLILSVILSGLLADHQPCKNFNINSLIEKIATSNILKVTGKATEFVEIFDKIPKDKIEKVTKFIGKFEKASKILEKVGKVAKNVAIFGGPVAQAVLLAFSIFSEENDDKFEKHFDKIFDRFDDVEAKLDEISNQISNLDGKLMAVSIELKLEIHFTNFKQIINDMATSVHSFNTTVLSYIHDPVLFKEKLRRFTLKLEEENNEFKLVNLLSIKAGSSKSLAEVFADVAVLTERNNLAPIASSTNQMIFEFYLAIMLHVYEGFSLLKLCLLMQEEVTGIMNPSAFRALTERRTTVIQKLMKCLTNSLQGSSTVGYHNFKHEQPVRLTGVLHFFWENESVISGTDTCSENCEHYQDVKFSGGDGCYGRLHDCQFRTPIYQQEKQLLQMWGQHDRIYEGFSFTNRWFGRPETTVGIWRTKKSYHQGFSVCHVCRCVCDMTTYSKTVRKFYTGKIESPEGYVVTGVRFREKNRVLFLQIEVGKLSTFGMIDSKSVHWQDLPNNDENVFEYGFYKRQFMLSNIELENQFLTGIQFVETSHGVLSFVIFGKNIESFMLGKVSDQDIENFPIQYSKLKKLKYLTPGTDPSASEYTVTRSATVEFGPSNEKTDAGQSFVPYFDGNDITLDTKAPLSGLGFLHFTKNPEFAGFIRPSVITLRHENFFNASVVEDFEDHHYHRHDVHTVDETLEANEQTTENQAMLNTTKTSELSEEVISFDMLESSGDELYEDFTGKIPESSEDQPSTSGDVNIKDTSDEKFYRNQTKEIQLVTQSCARKIKKEISLLAIFILICQWIK